MGLGFRAGGMFPTCPHKPCNAALVYLAVLSLCLYIYILMYIYIYPKP